MHHRQLSSQLFCANVSLECALDDKDRLSSAVMPFSPSLNIDDRSDDKLAKFKDVDNDASLYQIFLPTHSNLDKFHSLFEYDFKDREKLLFFIMI